MIPITRLSVGAEEAAAAAEAVSSGWLTQGPRVERFERAVAEYVGARHAIATNSCTTALHLALLAAGVKPGDDVICPSFTFIATANAIVHAGATPVFVDIDPRTYNIDPALIGPAVTARTSAIVPVSQIGLPADLQAIVAVARRHGISVVEDAAPSLGATIAGRPLGALSDLTCFSFDARKILTTGEGGMVTTNDDTAAARIRSLRAHAASVSAVERHAAPDVVQEQYLEVGCNYKLTDVQAAVGLAQMGRLESIIASRRELAARYTSALSRDPRLVTPHEPAGVRHVYQSYCVRVRGWRRRRTLMAEMLARGVATRRVMSCHLEPAYRGRPLRFALPETERADAETLLLPIYPGLSTAQQDEVIAALAASLDAVGAAPVVEPARV